MSLKYNTENHLIIRVFLRCQSLLDGAGLSVEPTEGDSVFM